MTLATLTQLTIRAFIVRQISPTWDNGPARTWWCASNGSGFTFYGTREECSYHLERHGFIPVFQEIAP